jgi:two-component system, response regulator PdtaR
MQINPSFRFQNSRSFYTFKQTMSTPLQVLIVEDEAIIADYISLCVEKMGHTVIQTLHEGEDVVAFIKTKKPQVVLLDIKRGGALDGVDV